MKKIRKVGRGQPRHAVDFYTENPDLYEKLQNGETIEVPDDVFPKLKGVVITGEDIINNTKTFSSSKKKSKTKSSTLTDSYIEANRKDRQPQEGDIVIEHNEEIKTEDKVED
jgi:hypothetical protein